jgi:hypothetical protein
VKFDVNRPEGKMSSDSEDRVQIKKRLSKRRSKESSEDSEDENTHVKSTLIYNDVVPTKRKETIERQKALKQMRELKSHGIKRLQQYEVGQTGR